MDFHRKELLCANDFQFEVKLYLKVVLKRKREKRVQMEKSESKSKSVVNDLLAGFVQYDGPNNS